MHRPNQQSNRPLFNALADSMQLTLQLPQTVLCPDTSALLEATTNSASSTSSSSNLTWATFEAGPPTPAAKCAELQVYRSTATSAPCANRHLVYRRLHVTVPSTPAVATSDTSGSSSCHSSSSARRVLATTASYSSVRDWLDQQETKRGNDGALMGACSHSPVALDPALLQGPTTPGQVQEPSAALPAPAFQLLGLL